MRQRERAIRAMFLGWLTFAAMAVAAVAFALAGEASAQAQLALADFDDGGLAVETLALIDVVQEVDGNWTFLYADADYGPHGTLVDGSLLYGAAGTQSTIGAFRYRETDNRVRFDRTAAPQSVAMTEYYRNGAGSDLTLYLQSSTQTIELAMSDATILSTAGDRMVLNYAAGYTMLSGLGAGDRLIVAFARPAPPPPSRVTDVSVTTDDHDSITVSWTAVTGATGYVVDWDDDSAFGSSTDATIPGGATTSYTITGLSEGTTYHVRVKATKTNADDGAWSDTADDTTDLQPPARVTGLNATALSDTEVELQWDLSQRAGAYLVRWRADDQQYDTGRQATTAALTQTISGLTPNVLYHFQVMATRNGADDAPASVEVPARTQPAPTPARVTGVSATAVSDSEIEATWNSAQHATGYVVEWDVDSAFPSPEQAAVAGTEVIIEHLRSETEYFVRVYGTRAFASDGPASAPDSATTDKARLKEWGDRFPGGPVAAQLGLAVFGGVMAGIRFRSHKSPQREAEIVGVMCLASLILPIIGIGNIFWTGGIVLLIGLASVAAIFLTSRH